MAHPGVIFGIAYGATTLSAISGGSSSLLTTPAWLALGFPLPAAVGADKVAGTFWTLVGARNYLRGRPVDWRLVAGMVAVGVVGAVLGAATMVSVDPAPLKRAVGGLIVAAVGLVAFRPAVARSRPEPRLTPPAMAAAALPLGFYEGLLGSGNSIAVTILLTGGRGFEFLRALGHYYLMASVWCGAAAASYWARGALDPSLTIPGVGGAVAGGYLGSRIGNRLGGPAVRGIFIGAGLILGGKLLLGW
jgi:uncharacterized membrane protein YfcA